MMLSSKNIELRILDESNLELLRNWRNSATVSEFMEYQEFISKEAQLTWFNQLTKSNNFYFIIYSDHFPVGMIHLGDVDNVEGTAQSGLFIAEEEYRGTGVAFSASVLLLEFAFESLNLVMLFAKVKNDNKQAQDYNRLLGFREIEKMSNDFSNWSLDKNSYEQKKTFLKQLIA